MLGLSAGQGKATATIGSRAPGGNAGSRTVGALAVPLI
jgi:hypothetical protein